MSESVRNKPTDQLSVRRHLVKRPGREHLQESKDKPDALKERFRVLRTQFVDLHDAKVPFVCCHGFAKLIGKRDILRSGADDLVYMFDQRFQ